MALKKTRHLLCSDLDELLEQLDSFSERGTQQDLGHDPLLNLVAALQELLQRHRVATARLTTEGVVHQLLLWRTRRKQM